MISLPPVGCCHHRRTGPRADGHACPGSGEHRAGGQQTAQSRALVLRARQPPPCTPWLLAGQVHQAKALKQVHDGSTEPGLMQELRTVTDFALRATKVTAWSLGKAMSTMVVQERHLWLNLAEMKYVDKARFLDTPATPSRALPSSSRRYSSRPRRSSTSCMMHHPPLPPGPGLSLPVAVGALLRPPELLCPRLNQHLGRRVEPLAGERRPPASQPGPKSSRKSTKRP